MDAACKNVLGAVCRGTKLQFNVFNIRNDIAHYDVAELAAEYDKQQEQYEKAKVAFKDAKDDYDCKIKELEDLEAQRQSVHVAFPALFNGSVLCSAHSRVLS